MSFFEFEKYNKTFRNLEIITRNVKVDVIFFQKWCLFLVRSCESLRFSLFLGDDVLEGLQDFISHSSVDGERFGQGEIFGKSRRVIEWKMDVAAGGEMGTILFGMGTDGDEELPIPSREFIDCLGVVGGHVDACFSHDLEHVRV